MATSRKKSTKSEKKKDRAVKPSQVIAETAENQPAPDEELKQDRLDDFLFHAANYIYVRRKLFIALAIALAVILSSAYGAFRYVQYLDNIRNEELFAIEKIIHNRGLTETQQMEQALPLLNRFIDSHPDTRQFILALLYRGGLYNSQLKYAEAEKDFETVRASLERDSELYVLASIYLSNVLWDQKKPSQAIEVLQSAQSEKMGDIVLMEMAELYLQTDQKNKARDTLEILLKDYPQSPHKVRAEQLLKLL
ncbi:tetratricopeptide repeat protein [bacterium]|nr:tetratricopeptide repeat protein [bacterium]